MYIHVTNYMNYTANKIYYKLFFDLKHIYGNTEIYNFFKKFI